MKERLVAIVGPTAVGKTEISLEVASKLNGEIISCDSMQVYRYMDIGTAKPSPAERARVPHHLIDVVDPDEPFNVAKYQELARAAISDITARGRLPILSGGTGLYMKAVTCDLLFPMEGASWELRKRLLEEAQSLGPGHLHARLAEIDPETARRLHPNDVRRVVRALEVYELTGTPLSEHISRTSGCKPRYDLVAIGLTRDRARLYQRIDERVNRMIEAGLVEETKRLLSLGYRRTLTSGQALGYREIVDYLMGRATLSETIGLIQRNTRRYAKRQLTWFRADPRIIWVDLDRFPSTSEACAEIEALIEGKLCMDGE